MLGLKNGPPKPIDKWSEKEKSPDKYDKAAIP